MEIFRVGSSQQIDNSALNANLAQTKDVGASNEVANSTKMQNENNKEEISKSLNETTKRLNEQMESLKTNIRFGYNDKISSMYVNVLEQDSGKLIRKIPTEEMMKLSEHFREIIGVIFDKKG